MASAARLPAVRPALILAVLLAGSGVAIGAYLGHRGWVALPSVAGWVLFLANILYRNSERVYLAVERLRLLFTQCGASWSARAELLIDGSWSGAVGEAAGELMSSDPASRELSPRQERAAVIFTHGMTVRLAAQPGLPPDAAPGATDSATLVVASRTKRPSAAH